MFRRGFSNGVNLVVLVVTELLYDVRTPYDRIQLLMFDVLMISWSAEHVTTTEVMKVRS